MNNREYRERDYPPNPYNREEYQPLPLTHYDQYHGFRGTHHPSHLHSSRDAYLDYDYLRHRGIRDEYYSPLPHYDLRRNLGEYYPERVLEPQRLRERFPDPYQSPHHARRQHWEDNIESESSNSAQVRGKIRACLNEIGKKVNRNFKDYVRPLRDYVMRPEHKILRPSLLEVTSFLMETIPLLSGSNSQMSKLVSTVSESIELYRVPDTVTRPPPRRRPEQNRNQHQNVPVSGHYAPIRDNNWTRGSRYSTNQRKNDTPPASSTKPSGTNKQEVDKTKGSSESEDPPPGNKTPKTSNSWNVSTVATSSKKSSGWNLPTSKIAQGTSNAWNVNPPEKSKKSSESEDLGTKTTGDHSVTTEGPKDSSVKEPITTSTINNTTTRAEVSPKENVVVETKKDDTSAIATLTIPKKLPPPAMQEEGVKKVIVDLATIKKQESSILETLDSNVSGPDQKDDDYSMDSVVRYYAKDSVDNNEEDEYDSEE